MRVRLYNTVSLLNFAVFIFVLPLCSIALFGKDQAYYTGCILGSLYVMTRREIRPGRLEASHFHHLAYARENRFAT
jgi:hypothetical protein